METSTTHVIDLEVVFYFGQSPLSCQLGEVALEQWAPWGRPPFGALMQLCFGTARDLSVAIAYLLSNRAEKPVSRPPGPCCALEFAIMWAK